MECLTVDEALYDDGFDDEPTNHARNEKKIITNKEKYNLRRFSSAKLAVRIPSTYNAMKKRGDLSELKTKRNTVLTR
jgi:hypothetical protein